MIAIDRQEATRALAKAIAFKECGKDRTAEEWAAKLVNILGAANILSPVFRFPSTLTEEPRR